MPLFLKIIIASALFAVVFISYSFFITRHYRKMNDDKDKKH